MSNDLFRRKRCMARLQRSWLKDAIEGCWHDLQARGYKRDRLASYANLWLGFGEFVAKQRDRHLEHLHVWVDPFVSKRATTKEGFYAYRSVVRILIRYLVQRRAIPALPPPPPKYVHSHGDLVDAYARFLRTHRGYSPQSIYQMEWCCGALLDHLNITCGPDLATTTPDAIVRFMTLQGQRYQRKTIATNCCIVRNFLIWLHRRGKIPCDLSGVVLRPRVFKHEQCPRYLTRSQVQAVLSAINRSTPAGCRDYAMILLLAVYGLRGCEVKRLRLDDIDWNRRVLHIRKRKAGNAGSYPLTESVAQAIITYLQKVRPASPHREVFLAMRLPHAPRGNKFHIQVHKYLSRAGIAIAHPGTHTFRYSCAQRLFEEGMSLKTIGDFLGHRNPDSTQRYTKIAIEQLRAIACGAGEDLL